MFQKGIVSNPDTQEKLKVFAKKLSNQEHEIALQIQREANQEIKWGPLTKLGLQVLIAIMRNIFTADRKAPNWISRNLLQILLPREEKSLLKGYRSHLFQEYIMLTLLRKLLGALKQEVGKRIDDLSPMLIEDEETILVEAAELEGCDLTDISHLIEHGYFSHTPAILEQEPVRKEYQTPNGRVLHLVPGQKIAPCGCTCENRIQTYVRAGDGTLIETTSCGLCGKKLAVRMHKGEKPTTVPCTHSHAAWVPGKEGKEAQCSKCGHPQANPERFRWQDAGLEPFGDDPSLDELIIIDEIFEERSLASSNR